MKKKLLYILTALVLLFGMLPGVTVQAAADWGSAQVVLDLPGDATTNPANLDIHNVLYTIDDTNLYVKVINVGAFTPDGVVSWTSLDIDSDAFSGDPNMGGDPSLLAGAEYRIDVSLPAGPNTLMCWDGYQFDYYPVSGGDPSVQITDGGMSIEISIPQTAFGGDLPQLTNGLYLKQVMVDTLGVMGPVDFAEGSVGAVGGGANPGDPEWWPVNPTIPDGDSDASGTPEIVGIDYVINDGNLWLRYIADSTFTFSSQQITTAIDIDVNAGTGDLTGMTGPAGTEYTIRTAYNSGAYQGTDVFRYDNPMTPLEYGGWSYAELQESLGYFYYTIPLTVFGLDSGEFEDGVVKIDAVVAGPGLPPVMIDNIVGVTGGGTLDPTASFNPTSGPVGTEVTVTGSNWEASETINPVTVGGETATHTLSVDGSGNLGGTLTIPSLSDGQQTVVITGSVSGGQTFTDAFEVTSGGGGGGGPTAVLNPVAGPVGTEVMVTGSDWGASESISQVTVGGETATNSLTVNAVGFLSGSITVPELTDGLKDIVITGSTSGAQTYTDAFTVTAPPSENIIRNGDFSSGFDQWVVNAKLSQDWNPVSEGRADVYTGDENYNGPVWHQNLNVTDIANTTFTISLDLTNINSYTYGNTVAVYLVYVDTSDELHKTMALNPANESISDATPFSADITMPGDARKLVQLVMVKESWGDFSVDTIALTASGVTVGPVPVITGLSATAGEYGSSLTITGTDFGTEEGEVSIGGLADGITITNWTDTSITVTVNEPARSGSVCVIADFVESNLDYSFDITSPNFTIEIMSDYLPMIEGGPVVAIVGIKFLNGFAPANGITLQMATDSAWVNETFAPQVHYVPGGAICRIDTLGIADGVYPITIEAVEDNSVTRTASFIMEITSTTDITFYQTDEDYNQNIVTEVNADRQGNLMITAGGTDSNGGDITPWLTLESSNPNVLGVYEVINQGYYIYAMGTGSANLTATAPDGYSENLPITVTVPADPAITAISMTPAVTTNLWQDTMTFYGEGSQSIGWIIYGMTSDQLTENTMDYSPDYRSYGGTFKLNPDSPPDIGSYLFSVHTGGYSVTSEAAAPLTVINDASYSALETCAVALDKNLGIWQIEGFTLEFYQDGVLQFSRDVFIHPGMGGPEPEAYIGAIPPGTYKLRYVPQNASVQDQWYPNSPSADYADEILFQAGQVVEDIYFFVMGYPEGQEANLVSVEILPANPNLNVDDTLHFEATAHYDNGYADEWVGYSAAWDSSNTTVASIDGMGNVQALAGGVTTISATFGGMVGSTTLTVNGSALESIEVLPANPVINAGETLQFEALGHYEGGMTENITEVVQWASSNRTVANVSVTGLATSSFGGTTNVTATLGGVTGWTILTVNQTPVLNVLTDNVTSITENSTVLNGALLSLDVSPVNVSFEWGTAPGDYPNETPLQEMTGPGLFEALIEELTANTTYYYRAKAVGNTVDYGGEMSFTTLAGQQQPLRGDVNGDGAVNILDMTRVARIILGYEGPVPAADVNGDTLINVLDMTAIIRIILEID
ncbi:MAG: Ig-like domain-containing protein [Dehalococcoidales bacterium]|nr:Ig-like domain-containing protein [Dehalococcoidales bacterium]